MAIAPIAIPKTVGVEIPASGRVSGVAVGVAEGLAEVVAVWAKTSPRCPATTRSKRTTRVTEAIFSAFDFMAASLFNLG